MRNTIIVICILLPLSCAFLYAQEIERQDTLPPSFKTDERRKIQYANERNIDPIDFKLFPSVVGESDFVKYVQTLPGVASGSDGSSNFYVRGSNMGANLQTIDGVPVYGTSHLVGLTTPYPAEIMESSVFQVGGFNSDISNLTASHIRLTTKDGAFDKAQGKGEISNLLVSAYLSTPIVRNKLSLNAAVRISPMPYLFNAISDKLEPGSVGIRKADAIIYDVFAKLKYRFDSDHSVSLSAFRSQDRYNFAMRDSSYDKMHWDNLLVISEYDGPWRHRGRLHIGLSYNHYTNAQGMIKQIDSTNNNLLIQNSLQEAMLQAKVNTFSLNGKWAFQYGINARYALFCPGSARVLTSTSIFEKTSSPLVIKQYRNFTGTLHGQLEYGHYDNNMFRLAGRLNYNNISGFVPEASALVRIHFIKQLGMEITGDYLSQFYHTLEGTPLGWSLDMIVPVSADRKPETCSQVYAGLFSDMGKHHLSLGAYYKTMNNLLWFSDATKLFDSAMAGWEQNIERGMGSSKGLEFMYEITGETIHCRLSYTLSKTDRLFPNVNKGAYFPAKFDRTHILNANTVARVIDRERFRFSVSALFTYQSGHMETVPAGSWWDSNFIIDWTEIDFHTTINNFRMPAYIRMDIGTLFEFNGGKCPQTLHVGIYNVFNRHNPFSLTYNPETKQWYQVSLIPIMPSLKYSISF